MHIKNIKYLLLSCCLCLIFTYKSHAFPYPEVQNQTIQAQGLTAESVENWLITKNTSQDYNGQHFFNLLPDRLHIQEDGRTKFNPDYVRITSEKGGTFSENIIKVEVKFCALDPRMSEDFKTVLIIKPLKNGPLEAMNLDAVRSAEKLKNINKKPCIHIAFHDHIFTYNELSEIIKNNKKRKQSKYFVLLHPASGQSLKNLIQKGNKNTLRKAFSTLGQQIGALHFDHMDLSTLVNDLGNNNDLLDLYKTTVIHGDAHWANIFYDLDSDLITLIDNETFSYALNKPISIARDLYCILLMPLIEWKIIEKTDGKKQSYLLECYCIFITGYISAYPSENTPALYEYIYSFLETPVKLSLARLTGGITSAPYSLTSKESNFLEQVRSSIVIPIKAQDFDIESSNTIGLDLSEQ